jgi:phospholipase/lecithinase/hemolysin
MEDRRGEGDGAASRGPEALHNGHADVIEAFGEAVNTADLSEQQRFDLFEANHEGTPALCSAIEHGHVDAVRAHLAAINASTLTAENKLELLLGRRTNGMVAFVDAICLANPRMLREVGEAMRQTLASVEDPARRQQLKDHVLHEITASTDYEEVSMSAANFEEIEAATDQALDRIATA